jgi:hypothetical protein
MRFLQVVGRACTGRRIAPFAVLCAAVPACFVGYDSRYFEAKNSQRRVAAQEAPSAIIASPDAPPPVRAARRALQLRVRPNRRYLAQTVDATKHVADLVADANGVLTPALALSLDVDRVEPWTNETDERLEPALAALAHDDAGSEVDFVLGLIGALPRPTDSLHELGMAELGGKHMVVRAPSRLGEQDAVERGFYELSEDDRRALLRKHERHRVLAVFLHELGHALGALHETDEGSLMRPTYSPKMNGFGGPCIALMRVALDRSDREGVARGQLELLRGGQGSWIAADRDAQIARLEATLRDASRAKADGNETSVSAGARLADGPGPSASRAAPPEIKGADRDRFEQALEALRAGRAAMAYQAAKPLFAAYPNVLAVQDLRCQLATIRWLEREQLKAECASYARLSPAGDAGADGGR